MKRFLVSVGLVLMLVVTMLTTTLTLIAPKKAEAATPPAGTTGFSIQAAFIDAAHVDVKVSGTYAGSGGGTIDLSALSGIYYTGNLSEVTYLKQHTYYQGGKFKNVGVPVDASGHPCQSSVLAAFPAQAGPTLATWNFSLPPKGTTSTQCATLTVDQSALYSIDDPALADGGVATDILYFVQDQNHISEVDNDSVFDSSPSNDFVLTRSNGSDFSVGVQFSWPTSGNDPYSGSCPNYLQVSGPQNGSDIPVTMYDQDNAPPNSPTPCIPTKHGKPPTPEHVLANTPSQIAAGNTNPPTGGASTTGDTPPADTCPLSAWQLKWIMCPIIEAISGLVSSLSYEIQNSVLIDVNGIFGANSGSPSTAYITQVLQEENSNGIQSTSAPSDSAQTDSTTPTHAAFNAFRALAYSLLLAYFMLMVVVTVTGRPIGQLNALTIQQGALPALAMMVALAPLWDLEKVFATVVNEIAIWGSDAIVTPFNSIHPGLNTVDGWSLITALLAVVGGLALLGPFAFSTFLVGVFFSLIVAAIIIAFIKMVMLGGFVALPIAGALYVFPWFKPFAVAIIKLITGGATFTILVFFLYSGVKIIMVLLPTSQGHVLYSIEVTGLFVGQNFAIGILGRRVSGAIGNFTGIVNDRKRGLNDISKNLRGKELRSRWQDVSTGKKNFLGSRRVTDLAVGAANIRNGSLGLTRKQRADYRAVRQRMSDITSRQALENDHGQAAGLDLENSIAVRRGMTRQRFVEEFMRRRPGATRRQADDAASRLEKNYGARIGTDAMRVTAYKARGLSNNGYVGQTEGDDSYYNELARDSAELMNDGLISSGDAAMVAKSNKARADTNGIGAGSWVQTFERAARLEREGVDSNHLLSHATIRGLKQEALAHQSAGEILGAHENSLGGLVGEMREQFMDARNAYMANRTPENHTAMVRQAARLASYKRVIEQISPVKAASLQQSVFGVQVPDMNPRQYGQTITIDRELKSLEGTDPVYRQLVNSFMQEIDTSMRGQAQAQAQAQAMATMGGNIGQPPNLGS